MVLNHIKNKMRVDKIEFNKTVILYCPIGKGNYQATFNIELHLDEYIPDYLDIEKWFKEFEGKHLIIEEAIEEVYQFFKCNYKPIACYVSCEAVSSIHFTVKVTKY